MIDVRTKIRQKDIRIVIIGNKYGSIDILDPILFQERKIRSITRFNKTAEIIEFSDFFFILIDQKNVSVLFLQFFGDIASNPRG